MAVEFWLTAHDHCSHRESHM